ncbi:hypothetical protein GCM10028895_15380 [Pontibacter rugosus]
MLLLAGSIAQAQVKDPIVEGIVKEANENSHLEGLAHELLDGIGPRLVGTPEMQKAHDWAVAKYKDWGIAAKNEKWGEWRGWQRGVTHVDMVHPAFSLWKQRNWPGARAPKVKALRQSLLCCQLYRTRWLFRSGYPM